MNTYLKPFIDSLNKLYTTGFQVETPAGQLTCRVAMLMSAVDLPARAIMANMKQFNGHYSCSWCEIEGISPPNLPMVSYFPYPLHKPTPRTNLRILVNAATATKENKSELGIKGPSILALHRPFDLATGFVVDALHCVFLGITKQLLSYWFSPKHAKKDCSIRKKLKICEKKLAAIRVPNFISRTPHLLEDFHTWKASECRSWILYYSIPVLKDVLPTPYIDHHALLVTSMHISFSDKITQQDLVLLKELLGKFYRQFTDLYGDFTATMNAHLLSHIPECVSKWGPLWAYSCFPFEGMNHALKLLFHGTRDMSYELATSYTLAQLLPTLTAISESKNIKSYIEKLYNNELSRDKQVAVKPLGRPDSIIPDGTIRQELSTLVDVPTGCIQSYKRVSLHGVTYTSTSYRRSVKRCDYAVQYAGHYGLVERYLLVREQLFAVVQTYSQQRSSQLSQHIVNCLPAVPHCRVVVSVHDIIVKCCFMDVGTDTVYFVCPPNKLRFD